MANKETYDENVLISQLRQGDEEAFEVLYNRYWEKLLTLTYHRTGSMETAKELLQDVFANLWRRRHQLHIQTTFAAYIFSAMKYTILDYIRSQAVKEKYIEAIKKTFIESDNTTLDFMAYDELNAMLEKEINKLPEKCQEVFRLSRMEHYSNKEIAEKLLISPKTVENQITKALKVLRANMQEFTTFLSLFFIFLD
ncbi:RNA polymerase sigma-70 factor [Catalinimonas niigatensis]|uniref:RNA polymerase sigma-70 factor n=1 Tax=Catalinimonas niigatensis TaxID=1397264 RepID=UPI002666C77C|nr:RNA polymerase sigma-70 factor [Catalinimonas niigatensis]WPP51915.1 RNA polymerase sigma-70 factor [Catalinimonas niigatensis]